MSPLTYLIVGSGWRAEFYGRIAAAYPGLFRAVYYCRSEEKAALMRARTDAYAFTSKEACLTMNPDFVVTAVDKAHCADVAIEWARRGFAVACETPAAPTFEGLKTLWAVPDAKITCMEQYHRYPILMAGLAAVDAGAIGEPYTAYLSAAHDYHGFSLIKKMLKTEGEGYTVRGQKIKSPVIMTDSRNSALYDGSIKTPSTPARPRSTISPAPSTTPTSGPGTSSSAAPAASGTAGRSWAFLPKMNPPAPLSCRTSRRGTGVSTTPLSATSGRSGKMSSRSRPPRTSLRSPRCCSTWRISSQEVRLPTRLQARSRIPSSG